MTPDQLAKSGTEYANQVALFAWAALNYDKYPRLRWMFAIPNARHCSVITGARFKAEGVRAGVWDIFLPAASANGWRGLWIEMKKPGGKLSPTQRDFGMFVRSEGYQAEVCYGWQEAVKVIEEYLENGLSI